MDAMMASEESAHAPNAVEHKDDEQGDSVTDPQIIFQERWTAKEKRIRKNSAIGHLSGWRLIPVIIKSNDDLRQEQICAQLISLMNDILIEDGVNIFLRPYEIIALSEDSGMIEAIPDTISLDCLKKRHVRYTTLRAFYQDFFTSPRNNFISFQIAQENFIRSLAPYSIVCYLLQIKDRHNGNILLDTEGHIIHIDYGFILGKCVVQYTQRIYLTFVFENREYTGREYTLRVCTL
jgi:phosphatidylinositol kinase/protein kinase (PI-3  family)